MKNITILGSTGSIGCSTLAVIRQNPDLFKAFALTGGQNVGKMTEQCLELDQIMSQWLMNRRHSNLEKICLS